MSTPIELRRSSIFSVPHDKLPVDKDGNMLPGYVLVTKRDLPLPPDATFAYPRHVLNGQPGIAAPKIMAGDMEIAVITPDQLPEKIAMEGGPINTPFVLEIVNGTVNPWSPEGLVTAWPTGHRYVMEATVTRNTSMGPAPVRIKMAEVGEGETPIQTLLVPHEWYGEKFTPSSESPAM